MRMSQGDHSWDTDGNGLLTICYKGEQIISVNMQNEGKKFWYDIITTNDAEAGTITILHQDRVWTIEYGVAPDEYTGQADGG